MNNFSIIIPAFNRVKNSKYYLLDEINIKLFKQIIIIKL